MNMDVSENRDTPKSSILIGFSTINHPFWGYPYCWKHSHKVSFLTKFWEAHGFFLLDVVKQILSFFSIIMEVENGHT